jgi:hypothetical protein
VLRFDRRESNHSVEQLARDESSFFIPTTCVCIVGKSGDTKAASKKTASAPKATPATNKPTTTIAGKAKAKQSAPAPKKREPEPESEEDGDEDEGDDDGFDSEEYYDSDGDDGNACVMGGIRL